MALKVGQKGSLPVEYEVVQNSINGQVVEYVVFKVYLELLDCYVKFDLKDKADKKLLGALLNQYESK